MKNLELTQMEHLSGGDTGGIFTGLACGITILAAAGVIAGSGGTAALPAAYIAGAVCGGGIGFGLASGDWW